jgi:hypothetical protein
MISFRFAEKIKNALKCVTARFDKNYNNLHTFKNI